LNHQHPHPPPAGHNRPGSRTPRKRPKKKRFSPWREDFIAAFALTALALFGLYRGVSSFTLTNTVIGFLIAFACGFMARWAWQNGMRRWYGKHLEGWAIERLSVWLKRKHIGWQAGRMVPGLGDADVLVQTSSGPIVIEIKSWQRWKNLEREAAAYRQVQALAQRLNAAHAFIWLPRGRPTFMQRLYAPRHGGIRVVFGNERKMYKQISKRHTPPTIAQRAAGLFNSKGT